MILEAENKHGPVFVGGFRSGSTMLINLLGMHPGVAVFYETKSICEPLRWIKIIKDPDQKQREHAIVQQLFPREYWGFSKESVLARMELQMKYTWDRVTKKVHDAKARYEHYPLGPDYILYSLGEAKDLLDKWQTEIGIAQDSHTIANATGNLINSLGDLQAKKLNRNIWINKTPEIPRMGRELRLSIGRCKIIHIIRNGRDVVRSAKQLKWGTVQTIAENWRDLILDSRAAAKEAPEDYIEIRYEELVANPVRTVNQILELIGLDRKGDEIAARYELGKGKKIGTARVRNWVKRLRGEDLRVFERIGGNLQKELGYE